MACIPTKFGDIFFFCVYVFAGGEQKQMSIKIDDGPIDNEAVARPSEFCLSRWNPGYITGICYLSSGMIGYAFMK